ncbi:hypothetical protein MHUMG1_06558 [Metarhizium humberi]|uniref:DUF7514 domain-containing protein n=1 Tax=Metarhizium humberi TaxID=2596975 RepID=A0A9P8S6J7_9HYPO|nr:hypothetical protein MHUMG1_06558 [Metarhizium humberi]
MSPPPSDASPVSGVQYTYMFEKNKGPTKQLDALLRTIARHVILEIGDETDLHLTPGKLATFYKAVGGDYDYNVFEAPSKPALTFRGFSRWESLEILLRPEEHVPFLQFAVKQWSLKHPETGQDFPINLPSNCFPTQPDREVELWHKACADALWTAADNDEEITPKPWPSNKQPSANLSVYLPSNSLSRPRQDHRDYLRQAVSHDQISQKQDSERKGEPSPNRLSPNAPPEDRGRTTSFSDYASSRPKESPLQFTKFIQPPTDSGYSSTTRKTDSSHDVQKGSLGDFQGANQVIEEQSEREEPSDTEVSNGQTDFTGASSVPSQRVAHYVADFSRDLRDAIPPMYLNGLGTKQLEDILNEFAIKIGHCPQTDQHYDIMYFVRKYRRGISRQFLTSPIDIERKGGPTMHLDDKMSIWNKNTPDIDVDPETYSRPPHLDDDGYSSNGSTVSSLDDEGFECGVYNFQKYRDCLADSVAYKWLLETLQRQVLLVPAVPNLGGAIKQQIIRSLPRSRNKVNWNPVMFVKEQMYNVSPDYAIESAITITGSSQDAQALTSGQYLIQTWGSDAVLRTIQEVIRKPEEEYSATLSDMTSLVAWYSELMINVRVAAPAPSIAEIGEQLAWLGAALRLPPRMEKPNGVWYCSPSIRTRNKSPGQQHGAWKAERCFEIHFTFEKVESKVSNGDCWHNMFNNPVIVRGYPITRRPAPNTGLEIPLATMAELTRTKRVTIFDRKFFIKGFSSMLALIEWRDGLFLWHLFYNAKGGRISYLDSSERPQEKFTDSQLESARHIVGWCSRAHIFAGAVDGTYDVRRSFLPHPSSTCVLDKVSLSGGKFVTGSVSITPGVRDTPIHLTRDDYVSKLEWIATKYVVLWDEGSKRGWLINGTTALLHLVRASLVHNATSKIKKAFLFKSEDMTESKRPYGADSAMDVLLDQKNKELKIYVEKVEISEKATGLNGEDSRSNASEKKTTYVRLEDRVEYFYHLLEKMIDHQIQIESRSGMDLKLRVRKYLEGWEFKELATRSDPLSPVVKTLPTIAKGWVDFTREIHAITLFGSGFGDIIRPAHPQTTCQIWSRLPSNKYYLAASVSDIRDIIDLDDNWIKSEIPSIVQICDRLLWHVPGHLFDPCRCDGRHDQETIHADVVQVLFPVKWKFMLRNKTTGCRLVDNLAGAVIFGHNSGFKWYWQDNGDPVQGDACPEPVELEAGSDFHDSGIGSSDGIGTSSTSLLVGSNASPSVKRSSGEGVVRPGQSEKQTTRISKLRNVVFERVFRGHRRDLQK